MKSLLLGLVAILFVSGCQQRQGENEKQAKVQEIQTRGDTIIGEGYVKLEPERFVATERSLAISMLDKYLENDPEPMQILAGRTFEIVNRVVVNQETENKQIEGEWISFSQDFTYEWYRDSKMYQRGNYFYGMKTDLLLLLGDNEEDFPSEWKLKSASDIIVLIGTSTFKNNSTQMRMVLKDH
jgi:hypothetical protein